ncbi:MAG: tRNA (adenosine(37)-N6)-threonylcarbamoyltransferase complex ATPase subunit type 1 TsaE [Calditrichaceae bacterium]
MKRIKQINVYSEEDTRRFAAELAGLLKIGDTVLLEGDLGTGKTFLVKEICRVWKTEDEPSSPSFAILHQYNGPVPVNHFDFYRIEEIRELDNLGWEEHLNNNTVTFIEWPGLIEKQLKTYYKIQLNFNNQGRQITLNQY